jgi:hypothetical protein
MTQDVIILDQPHQIEAASWFALRGALKMEAIGMKRGGRSVNSIACERLGLKKGTRVKTTLDVLETFIRARYPEVTR